jgi:hypothetical protein
MNLKVNSPDLKRNSVVVLGLIIVHLVVKHKLVHLKLPPLRLDPCDAVGAFALITIALIVVGFLYRTFNRYLPSPALQYLYVARSQQAVVLAILITLIADFMVLGRHPAMWIRIVSPMDMFALFGSLTAVAVGTEFLILIAQEHMIAASSLRWTRIALLAVIPIVVLGICPEWPIHNDSETMHILTVTLGALVLFVPMRLLLFDLVPNRSEKHEPTTIFGTPRECISVAVGAMLMAFGFWLDATKRNSSLRHVHPAGVIAIAGILIAYAFLGAPLGFAGNPSTPRQNPRTVARDSRSK